MRAVLHRGDRRRGALAGHETRAQPIMPGAFCRTSNARGTELFPVVLPLSRDGPSQNAVPHADEGAQPAGLHANGRLSSFLPLPDGCLQGANCEVLSPCYL